MGYHKGRGIANANPDGVVFIDPCGFFSGKCNARIRIPGANRWKPEQQGNKTYDDYISVFHIYGHFFCIA